MSGRRKQRGIVKRAGGPCGALRCGISEGEKGGWHTRLRVISAWRPARASALPVLGALSRSPTALLMTDEEAEGLG